MFVASYASHVSHYRPAPAAVAGFRRRSPTATWSDDVIRIRLRGPELVYQDLRDGLDGLLNSTRFDSFRRVIFEFSEIESIRAPWTPVFALLFAFARRVGRRCCVESLRGRPAAMAELLFGARDLNALLQSECLN